MRTPRVRWIGRAMADTDADPWRLVPCMGGWCAVRERCAHYRMADAQALTPVERLCGEVEEPELMTRQQ